MAKGARARARVLQEQRTPLERVRDDLAGLEEQRRRLLQLRDELVTAGRAAGRSWDSLAAEAGTTRQALLKRAGS